MCPFVKKPPTYEVVVAHAIFELVVVVIWAHAMCPYGLLCRRDVKNVFRRGTLHVPAVRVGVSTRCEKHKQKILAENVQKKQAFYNSFVGAHCMCPPYGLVCPRDAKNINKKFLRKTYKKNRHFIIRP